MDRHPSSMKNYINATGSLCWKMGSTLSREKSIFIFMFLLSILALNCIHVTADSYLLQLQSDETALIKLNEHAYCYIWFKGINVSKGELWLCVGDKENINKLIAITKMDTGKEYSIALEETEVIVKLQSIIDENTVFFEIRTDLKDEKIEVLIEKVDTGITASFIPTSIIMGASFIAAAWCLVQGMTIGASTMAEKGESSIWGTALSISGLLILFLGLFSGLTALMRDILPLFFVISALSVILVMVILGVVLSIYVRGSKRSSRLSRV
ncbi:hypothetical protein J7L60_04465 [Candidatus Bathyarchaeota archaeon]|nr:hypothetical protein [Candidatus Bathyarchaeota archaeon]